jgi:hypothetical protein
MDGTVQTISAIYDEEQFVTDIHQMFAFKAEKPKLKMAPELLAKTWIIGWTVAENSLRATTQRAV